MEGVMEGPSNGGLLYHEAQESNLCAVHCVNSVLQGPFFSEIDLAALASDLDQRERQMMLDGGGVPDEASHNVSMGGDFSIQVLQKALEVWDLRVIPLESPEVDASKYDPELEKAFICHLQDHWFCIREVNGEWYNFNSLYAAPEHLSRFYLSAFLDTLKGSGWSIFLVRGSFPKDCPITTSQGFGQWFTPEDAARMTKSCNQSEGERPRQYTQEQLMIAEQEEQDLYAAITASLLDSAAASAAAAASASSGAAVAASSAAATATATAASSSSSSSSSSSAAAAAATAVEQSGPSDSTKDGTENSGTKSDGVEDKA